MRKRLALFLECLGIRVGYFFGRYTKMEKDLAIGYVMTREDTLREIKPWQSAALEVWDRE